jgi:hypothetical protein
MRYRDDITAALSRVEQLETELAEAREENDELRGLADPPPPSANVATANPISITVSDTTSTRPLAAEAPRGALYYDPPATYFPLLTWLVLVSKGAFRRIPDMHTSTSNSVLFIVWHWAFVWPLVNLVWRPLYVAALLLWVLPLASVLSVVGSLLLLPIIVLARLRLRRETLVGPLGQGWPQPYDGEDGCIMLYFLVAITMAPLTPVMLPLVFYFEEDEVSETPEKRR